MSNRFVIEISSDLDFEEMVVNILYNEEQVAIVSQEKGIENLEIRIFPPTGKEFWDFFLHDFIEVLESAKKTLISIKKTEN